MHPTPSKSLAQLGFHSYYRNDLFPKCIIRANLNIAKVFQDPCPWSGRMTQEEKVLADPDDLSPTPRAYMMEQENLLPVLIF